MKRGARVGAFVVQELLGSGAFADVWAAKGPGGIDVALKVLRPDAATPEVCERFAREARIALRLTSPLVCRAFTAEVTKSPMYIAYQHIRGATLASRFEACAREAYPTVRALLVDLLTGLQAAHELGIVHRDVSPANIVVDAATGRAILIDFGVATAPDDEHAPPLTQDALLGSLPWLAPEQAEGNVVDARADLYAAGAIGFSWLAGRPPFVAPSAAALLSLKTTVRAPTLAQASGSRWPKDVEAWFATALERLPDARFASARAMLDALPA